MAICVTALSTTDSAGKTRSCLGWVSLQPVESTVPHNHLPLPPTSGCSLAATHQPHWTQYWVKSQLWVGWCSFFHWKSNRWDGAEKQPLLNDIQQTRIRGGKGRISEIGREKLEGNGVYINNLYIPIEPAASSNAKILLVERSLFIAYSPWNWQRDSLNPQLPKS